MSAHAPFDLAHEIEQQAQALNKIAPGLPRPTLCPFCISGYTGGMVDRLGVEHGLTRCRHCNGTTTLWIGGA